MLQQIDADKLGFEMDLREQTEVLDFALAIIAAEIDDAVRTVRSAVATNRRGRCCDVAHV